MKIHAFFINILKNAEKKKVIGLLMMFLNAVLQSLYMLC